MHDKGRTYDQECGTDVGPELADPEFCDHLLHAVPYTFEWAVPLDSHDANDLRAKPGDEFRFNIAFFDHFTADLKDTQAGGLFGADFNHAAAWGTLRLADKVQNDGGTAFRGPA